METKIKKQVLNSLIWRFMERSGAQGVTFVVSIVLARLLAPEIYGIVAIVMVITSILQVFVDSGMGNALIQKKDADDLDFSSVFYFNLVASSILYCLLYACSPLIAAFYNNDQLTPVLRVLGLSLIISGVKNVQQAYVSKHFQFKKFFFATLGGTLGAAIIGIILALYGFGIWALVVQYLVNATIDVLILWISVKWRPIAKFSIKRLGSLINYGWKLLASSLLHTVYTDLRTLIIGKVYSTQDLAYYSKGISFPAFVVNNINSSIDSVLLPAMSSVQDETSAIRGMTRRSIMVSSYIIWPMMIGLATIAKPLIIFLLTEKWILAVPFLQIACVSNGLAPLQTANLNAIKAIGRSDLFLKLEITKKTISIMILLIFMRMGVMAIALSSLAYAFIATVINSFPNKKLLNYSYYDQIRDILPSFISAIIMGMVIYPITLLNIPVIVIILLQITAGAFVYLIVSRLLCHEAFDYIKSTVLRLVIK